MRTSDRFPIKRPALGLNLTRPPRPRHNRPLPPEAHYYPVMASVIFIIVLALTFMGLAARRAEQAENACSTATDCAEHVQLFNGLSPKDLPR